MKKAVFRFGTVLFVLFFAACPWSDRPQQASAVESAAASTANATTPAIHSIRNSLGMKLVKIPAGEFVMGNLEAI